MQGKMGGLSSEGFFVPSQNRHGRVEIQLIIRPKEPFEQPASDEARPAGKENTAAIQAIPKRDRVLKDVAQIDFESMRAHSQNYVDSISIGLLKGSI